MTRPRSGLETLVLVAGLLAATAPSSAVASLADDFPALEARADSLRGLVVLVEVSQIVDVRDGSDQFDLRASRKIAARAVAALPAKLRERGWPIADARIASIGGSLPKDFPLVWLHREGAPTGGPEATGRLPVDVDTTLSSAADDWGRLLDGLWSWRHLQPPGEEPPSFPAAVAVSRRFGADAIVVLMIAGARQSVARKLLRHPFDPGMPAHAPRVALRILDARDGRLLWSDDELSFGRLDNRLELDEILGRMVLRLPRRR